MDFNHYPATVEEMFAEDEPYKLPERKSVPKWTPPVLEPADPFAELLELGKLRVAAGIELELDHPHRANSEQPTEIRLSLSKRTPDSRIETNKSGWRIERDARGSIVRATAPGVSIPKV